MNVIIYEPVRKLIRNRPISIRRELGVVLQRLQENEFVGMPDVKAMSAVGKGVFEIQVKSADGSFRVFYVIKQHKTPQKEIETAKTRLKMYLETLNEE